MKRFSILLAALLVLLMAAPAAAQEPAPTPIHTPQELAAIAQDPTGSYILMADLDMAGIAWQGPDFSGHFDGNGHAIVNLTLTTPGQTRYNSYDGNAKAYETDYYGLFSGLVNARVENLKLINVRALVDTDSPAFLAGLAGYIENSTIENCHVSGCLELRAHDRIYGVAGIAGYGCGTVSGCTADVTLICTDTDPDTKCEQFLGGVYGTGFIDVIGCNITLDGYISEHGYVHSGGITGMYYQYPWGVAQTGTIQDNHVAGKITFYEQNPDRRAYCGPFAGESLVYYPFMKGVNTQEFLRDEKWHYDQELRPEMCENPTYTQTVTAPDCTNLGYTTFTCDTCGYSYTDCYTLTAHTLTVWKVTQPATLEAEGTETAACDLCALEFTRSLAKLEPLPTETQPPQTLPPETQAPEPEPQPEDVSFWPILIPVAAALLIAIVVPIILKSQPKGKYQK